MQGSYITQCKKKKRGFLDDYLSGLSAALMEPELNGYEEKKPCRSQMVQYYISVLNREAILLEYSA